MDFSHYPPFFFIPFPVLLWPFFPQSPFLLSCLLFVCLFLVWALLGTDSWALEWRDPLLQSSSLPYLSSFSPPFPESSHLSLRVKSTLHTDIKGCSWTDGEDYCRLQQHRHLLSCSRPLTEDLSNHTSLAFLITCHLTKLLWFLTEPSISAFRFHEYVKVLICHFKQILASLKCYQNDRHVKSLANKSFLRNYRQRDNVWVTSFVFIVLLKSIMHMLKKKACFNFVLKWSQWKGRRHKGVDSSLKGQNNNL